MISLASKLHLHPAMAVVDSRFLPRRCKTAFQTEKLVDLGRTQISTIDSTWFV